MIRIILENVLLFLLPTFMYVAYVLLTRRSTSAGTLMNDAPLLWLFAAGAAVVAVTLVYYGTTTPGGRPDQTYTPPRYKDGQIEPGELK